MEALIETGITEAAQQRRPPRQADARQGRAAGPVPDRTAGIGARLVALVSGCLDDAKAEETTVIDLAGKTSIADAMIITSGRSSTHVAAISDRVLRALKEDGAARDVPGTARIEGLANGDWVLIDAGDIIVHIFRPEVRQFYNLEKMWGADRPLAV